MGAPWVHTVPVMMSSMAYGWGIGDMTPLHTQITGNTISSECSLPVILLHISDETLCPFVF